MVHVDFSNIQDKCTFRLFEVNHICFLESTTLLLLSLFYKYCYSTFSM